MFEWGAAVSNISSSAIAFVDNDDVFYDDCDDDSAGPLVGSQ